MEFLQQDYVLRISGLWILFLVLVLAVALHFLIRVYIVIKILRYELISLSEWSAQKLNEISESASHAIVTEVRAFRPRLGDHEAKMFIPLAVSDAVKDWEAVCDKTQARLIRNGVKPLNIRDKQFLLSDLMR